MRRRWTDEETATAIAMHAVGTSINTICVVLDRPKSSVFYAINPENRKEPQGPSKEFYPIPDYRKASFNHLRDILSVHGYEARWPAYRIPPESRTNHVPTSYTPSMSLVGSSAAEVEMWA